MWWPTTVQRKPPPVKEDPRSDLSSQAEGEGGALTSGQAHGLPARACPGLQRLPGHRDGGSPRRRAPAGTAAALRDLILVGRSAGVADGGGAGVAYLMLVTAVGVSGWDVGV